MLQLIGLLLGHPACCHLNGEVGITQRSVMLVLTAYTVVGGSRRIVPDSPINLHHGTGIVDMVLMLVEDGVHIQTRHLLVASAGKNTGIVKNRRQDTKTQSVVVGS